MPMASRGGVSGGPMCPSCGLVMVVRTARQGRNAGNSFWGCSSFPRCRETQPLDAGLEGLPHHGALAQSGPGSGGEAPSAPPGAPRTAVPPSLRARRVDWFDGTLQRSGWRAYYATVGGSLRSVPDRRVEDLANCWVARQDRQDRTPAGDSGTLGLVEGMRKLLSRGVAPPLHPDAECSLLELAGLGSEISGHAVPGDIAPRLKRAHKLDAGELAVPSGEVPSFESAFTESDEEWRFVQWVADRSPGAVRWLVPQFSLGHLIDAAGPPQAVDAAQSPAVNQAGLQRCDFLFAPVGLPPVVIEIDGGQHEEQVAVDDDRDRRLEAIGVRTIRVPTRELAAGDGPGLRDVDRLLASIPNAPETPDPLVWGPIQVAPPGSRLVRGPCWRLPDWRPSG